MTRWNLSNYFRKVSFNQFLQLGQDFKDACEQAFETECRVDARFLSSPKVYTTFLLDDEDMKSFEEENRRAEIVKTTSLDELTQEQWNKARYAEINVSPVNRDSAPDYAFGHAEFKGTLPRSATFYMQGGPDRNTELAAHHMCLKHRWQHVGNGFESNGSQSARGLISAAGALGMPANITARLLTKGRNFDF